MDKQQLEKRLRESGVSGVYTKRIIRLMNEFATPEAFFSASKGELMKAFNRTHSSKRGIGNNFWKAFDMASRIYRCRKDDSENAEIAKTEESKMEYVWKTMFPVDFLKTVVSFMELCDIDSIDLVGISQFLGSVHIKHKPESKPEENAQ
jgi:hypothetical protein